MKEDQNLDRFDREDPAPKKEEAYKAFTKDKRTHTTSNGGQGGYHKKEYSSSEGSHGGYRKREYTSSEGDRGGYRKKEYSTSDSNRGEYQKREYSTSDSGRGGYQKKEYSTSDGNRGGGYQKKEYSTSDGGYRKREYSSSESNREGYHKKEYTPREGEQRRRSYNPNFSSDNRFIGGEKRPDNRESYERRPYEKREGQRPYGESRPYGDKKPYGESKPYGERKAYGENKPFGDRKPFGDKPYGDRKPYGERKPYAEKPYGDKQYGDKPSYGDRKPYGDRPYQKRDADRVRPERAPRYNSDNYPTFPAPAIEDSIRLNRYIAMSGICSRREADEFITSGMVTVNDVVVTELGSKVSANDEIKFNGNVLQNEKKVYIVMNKPKGYVTSVDDPHAEKTVMDLLRNGCRERVYPVGRLDKTSMGVLLVTNDGDMAKKLTHPSYEKKKVYQVSLDKPLTKADMDSIVAGIMLDDGEIHADAISYVDGKKTEIGIEIHSGRNRIVRRLFEHLGYRVKKLDRVYFAGLTKQRLRRGEWRFLTPREVQALQSGQYE